MSSLRKIIIVCIVFFSIFFLWLLLLQRASLQKLPSNSYEAGLSDDVLKQQNRQLVQEGFHPSVQEGFHPSVQEGFHPSVQEGLSVMGTYQSNELQKVTSTMISPNIKSYLSVDSGGLPLREYCIKASYNTACTGSYVSLDMIKFVLSRGCRFLDFEVYYLNTVPLTQNNGFSNAKMFQPCVAFSDDPMGLTMKSKNYLPLSEVLYTIQQYGFQAPSPNSSDPLFVQLRIFSEDTQIFQDIADLISYKFSKNNNLHTGIVNKDTKLIDIQGQIVLVVDTNHVKIPVPSDSSKKGLTSYINMNSGGSTIAKFTPEQMSEMLFNIPKIVDNQNISTVKGFVIVEPGGVKTQTTSIIPLLDWLMPSNPVAMLDVSFFVQNYGVQIMEFPFYVANESLIAYEKFFSDIGTAFVPMYLAIGTYGSSRP